MRYTTAGNMDHAATQLWNLTAQMAITVKNLFSPETVIYYGQSFNHHQIRNPHTVTRVVVAETGEIGPLAFRGYVNLREVIFFDNRVKKIGNYAFSGCPNLKSITLPNAITAIGESAFQFTGLESVDIPRGVTSLGDDAFSCCYNLKTANLPDSLATIGDHAFYRCLNLQWAVIPQGVERVGKNAFHSCKDLRTLIVRGRPVIENYAFAWCPRLERAVIADAQLGGDKVFHGSPTWISDRQLALTA